MKFILAVRNDGLGDLLLTLPTLLALHQAHPEARLGVLVRPDHARLFELYPHDIEVWCDDAQAQRRFAVERPEAMLFLRPDPAWARRAFLARVPRRIGTRHRWQSVFFNERVPVRRRNSGFHEAECNGLVAAPLGVSLPLPRVRLHVPEAAKHAGLARVERGSSRSTPYVVIHPGSHGSSPNWPPAFYAELASQLAVTGVRVVVTCGPAEVALCRQVAGSQGTALDPVDLVTLAAVVSGAALVVAGSTGPMHLACALGVPVVALFSARPPHTPERWGPWDHDGCAHVFQSQPVAGPGGHEDLSGLAPDLVLAAVVQRVSVGRAVR